MADHVQDRLRNLSLSGLQLDWDQVGASLRATALKGSGIAASPNHTGQLQTFRNVKVPSSSASGDTAVFGTVSRIRRHVSEPGDLLHTGPTRELPSPQKIAGIPRSPTEGGSPRSPAMAGSPRSPAERPGDEEEEGGVQQTR